MQREARLTESRGKFCIIKLLCLVYAFTVLPAGESFAGWKLTFCEDFKRPSLGTIWKLSDLWSNQTLAGNNEKQCYLPEGVEQSGGLLKLKAAKNSIRAAQCRGAKFDLNYASGMVTTAGCNIYEKGPQCAALSKFSQAHGFFEVSAKLPKGKGLWPAFWLAPMDASWPPEIDVMEVLGHEISKVYTTYHYKDSKGEHQSVTGSHSGPDLSEGFNRFGIDWQPGRLTWYLNGQKIYGFSGPEVSDKPMYMLINLGVGGNWPGDPDETAQFPATMEIAYVHAFSRAGDDNADGMIPTGDVKCSEAGPR